MGTSLDEAISAAMTPSDTTEDVTADTTVSDVEATADVDVDPEPTVQEKEPAPTTTEEVIEAINAPDQWSGFAKTKFNLLPKEVQKELSAYYGQVAEQKKVYDAIEQALGENKQAVVATYGGIDQMVKHYHQLDLWAAQDPVGLIKWFAQGRGIDLGSLIQQPKPAQEPANTQHQQQGNSALEQKIAELEKLVRDGQAGAVNQIEAQAAQKIAEFAKDPNYPFFNDLKAEMKLLLESGRAKDLPDAYQKAMMLNDKTRDQYIQDQLEAKNKEKIANAQKSKQAATIKPTGNASGKGAKGPSKLDDIINEAMANRV